MYINRLPVDLQYNLRIDKQLMYSSVNYVIIFTLSIHNLATVHYRQY